MWQYHMMNKISGLWENICTCKKDTIKKLAFIEEQYYDITCILKVGSSLQNKLHNVSWLKALNPVNI